MADNSEGQTKPQLLKSRTFAEAFQMTAGRDIADTEHYLEDDDSGDDFSRGSMRSVSEGSMARLKAGFKRVASGWAVPRSVRFDYEFYRTFFLNMKNDDFNVSTMQVLLSFERLCRLLQINMSRDLAKQIVRLQGSDQIVTWDAFSSKLNELEENSGFVNRVEPGGEAEFHLEAETSVALNGPERLFLTIEDSSSSNWGSLIGFIRIAVILLSTVGIILDAEPSLKIEPSCALPVCTSDPVSPTFLYYIEMGTIIAFTVDYVARLLAAGFVRHELIDRPHLVEMCTGRKSYYAAKTFMTRFWYFFFSFFSVIDLITILPFFIRLGIEDYRSKGLQVFRVIRLTSIVRLMRIRQFRDVRVILYRAFAGALSALALLFMGFLIVILFFAVLVFYQESGKWYPLGAPVANGVVSIGAFYRPTAVDPASFELTPFKSVTTSLWWALVTATTIGYGDMFPASGWGRFIASFLALSGVIVLAMPIAVIGSNFTTEYQRFYAIRDQLVLLKDKKIQAGVMARYIEDLDDGSDDENAVSEGFVDGVLVDRLTEQLKDVEGGEAILAQLETLETADASMDEVRTFLVTAGTQAEALKEKVDAEKFDKIKKILVDISFDLIRKITLQK